MRSLRSRIELAAAGASLQVKGKVQSLDATAQTFVINGLKVNYSSVVPTGDAHEHQHGSRARHGQSTNGVLTATLVRVLGAPAFTANNSGRFEGLITSFTSNAAFAIGAQQITTDSTTVFDLGGASLGVDVPVRVRGTFNAVRRARREPGGSEGEEAQHRPRARRCGFVHQQDADGDGDRHHDECQHLLRGQVEPERAVLQPRRRADRGLCGSSGCTRFGQLAGRDPGRAQPGPMTGVFLQGLAANLANPSFTILGVQVMTNGQTKFNGPGGAQQFFTDAVGQTVKVQGTFTGGVLVADQVQIKH